MDIFLQIWGGGFYLSNKILFALAEGKDERRKRLFRIWGWLVYLLGVPAWVIILVGKQDWIAASIEAGGVPSMVFGLYTVFTATTNPHNLLDRCAALFTYFFIFVGVSYSINDYGGLTSLSQFLEIGVMIGFLLGSYFLAKNNTHGWLFFMVMNSSMSALMLLQGKPFLAVQQIISLTFVIYGYTMAMRSKRGD